MSDAELLWRWANDPDTRRNAFQKAPIPYAEHVSWLERRLGSETTRILIFTERAVPIGQVRFDLSGEVADIDISVAPERRGRGYGTAMLQRAIERLREERGMTVRPRALVLSHNLASLRLFKACGFTEVGVEEREGGERAVVLELARDPEAEE